MFTKGPWEVNTQAGRPNREVFSVNNELIADCGIGGALPDEVEANARLVAQAPAMAELLAHLAEQIDDQPIMSPLGKLSLRVERILAEIEGAK